MVLYILNWYTILSSLNYAKGERWIKVITTESTLNKTENLSSSYFFSVYSLLSHFADQCFLHSFHSFSIPLQRLLSATCLLLTHEVASVSQEVSILSGRSQPYSKDSRIYDSITEEKCQISASTHSTRVSMMCRFAVFK